MPRYKQAAQSPITVTAPSPKIQMQRHLYVSTNEQTLKLPVIGDMTIVSGTAWSDEGELKIRADISCTTRDFLAFSIMAQRATRIIYSYYFYPTRTGVISAMSGTSIFDSIFNHAPDGSMSPHSLFDDPQDIRLTVEITRVFS